MKRRTMLSLAATSALAKATATATSSSSVATVTNYLSLRSLSHPQRNNNIHNYNILQACATNSESDITHLVSRFPPRGGASVRNAAATSKPSLSKPQPTPFSSAASASSSSMALFASAPGEEAPTECPFTKFAATFGGFWGSFGVIYILAKAIARVLPIAMEPFHANAGSSLVLSPIQWSLYAFSCLFFAYAEGYKGFHLKFAPLVVKRSFTLVIGTPQGNNVLNYFLAPLYSMGLWGATKKRRIVSWSVSLGVAMIVAIVKKLPPMPRCILDAGVVVGLTIGSASILYHFVKSVLTGKLPDIDACIPSARTN